MANRVKIAYSAEEFSFVDVEVKAEAVGSVRGPVQAWGLISLMRRLVRVRRARPSGL